MIKDDNTYAEFLKRNFPSCPVIDDTVTLNIYNLICQNNVLTNIFLARILDKYPKFQIGFLELYQKQLNKILIYIGLNESDGLNYCVRSLVEYLLKFFYSVKIEESFDKINKFQYRHLSEELRKKEEGQIDFGDNIQIFLNYYGLFSNELHGKADKITCELDYLQQIISNKHIDYNKIFNALKNIIYKYFVILIQILDLSVSNLSFDEILRIRNVMTEKQVEKIFINIYL